MKILIMGLPGSGKTTLAEKLAAEFDAVWFNADQIRKLTKFDCFSENCRNIQAKRMKTYADFEVTLDKTVICDFVCPTHNTRKIFNADFTIWMDTIDTGRYEDTNLLFERPTNSNCRIKDFNYEISKIIEMINNQIS